MNDSSAANLPTVSPRFCAFFIRFCIYVHGTTDVMFITKFPPNSHVMNVVALSGGCRLGWLLLHGHGFFFSQSSFSAQHVWPWKGWKGTGKGWRQATPQGAPRPDSRNHQGVSTVVLYCFVRCLQVELNAHEIPGFDQGIPLKRKSPARTLYLRKLEDN